MTLSAQCLDGLSIEQCLKVEIRRAPEESSVDRKTRGGSPEDGRNVKDSRANRTQRKSHGVGCRAPESKGCHQELFVHGNLYGREPDGIMNAESFPLLAKELLHPINPSHPGCSGRRPGSMRLRHILFRPLKPLS